MKTELDDFDLIRCKYQADLFEYVTEEKIANSASFIKAFAYSDLAKIMDKRSFLREACDVPEAYERLTKEKKIRQTNKFYPVAVMSWIGYLMKYWQIEYNTSTENIYKIIKPQELKTLYEAYHSLDVSEAIERILEAKHVDYNRNNVELMRKIYKLDYM